jgi:hypothetical protein
LSRCSLPSGGMRKRSCVPEFDAVDIKTLSTFITQRALRYVDVAGLDLAQVGVDAETVAGAVSEVGWDLGEARRRTASSIVELRASGKVLGYVQDPNEKFVVSNVTQFPLQDSLRSSSRRGLEAEMERFVLLSVERHTSGYAIAGHEVLHDKAVFLNRACARGQPPDAKQFQDVVTVVRRLREGAGSEKIFDRLRQRVLEPVPEEFQRMVSAVLDTPEATAAFGRGWDAVIHRGADWMDAVVDVVNELRDARTPRHRIRIAKSARVSSALSSERPIGDIPDGYYDQARCGDRHLVRALSRLTSFDAGMVYQRAAIGLDLAWADAARMNWKAVRRAVQASRTDLEHDRSLPRGRPDNEGLVVTFGLGSEQPEEMARRAVEATKFLQSVDGSMAMGLDF